MDFVYFALVNIPVSIVNFLVNTFLMFCMLIRQQGAEHLKQPLKVLLGTIVGCNIALQICIFLFAIVDWYSPSLLVYDVTAELLYFGMRTSVTTSLWLNIFYYCQIVPAQHPVLIFLKKNIRIVIYSSMLGEKIFFLFGLAEKTAFSALFSQMLNGEFYTAQWNVTSAKIQTVLSYMVVDLWVRCFYLSLCLCLMLTSSCATILYLWNHMKSMGGSSSFVSSPNLQRQMRVTITGIIQTFLFFLCLIWMLIREFFNLFYQNIDIDSYIGCTVVCLYAFGTTINLCVGQTIFRQCVYKVWQKCLQTVTLLSK